ncbi:MAG: glutathione S-transferase [Kofleriaceae bacterium]
MYELVYWPEIQGRGEFVRLVLEDAGVSYVDVAREGGDVGKLLATELTPYAFAVPVLREGDVIIPQTVAITRFLGERHGLAPPDERGRLLANAVALTIADLVSEVHDTHHPISVARTYDKQRESAALRATAFRDERLPKFLSYLEDLLGHDTTRDGRYLVGDDASYADLAAFQILEGLAFAFPRALSARRSEIPKLLALRDRIAERPRIAAYLGSSRRLAFNQSGIFRHYPELDP